MSLDFEENFEKRLRKRKVKKINSVLMYWYDVDVAVRRMLIINDNLDVIIRGTRGLYVKKKFDNHANIISILSSILIV